MAKLAICGGEPLVKEPLGKPWPIFGEEERTALMEVLESGKWWFGGWGWDYTQEGYWKSKVGQFERAFAEFQGAKFGVAVCNGTVAIEAVLKAIGVEAGDEVIVPAATFIATVTAVLRVNAIPIFVDIDPRNYTIDPKAVESAITPRTKAVIPVDVGGMPCDYDALNEIAKKHKIYVIADCAHSHGSQWKRIGTGAVADAGTFSFQMGKTLTCGEGGMVITNDEEIYEKTFAYHHIGRLPGKGFYEHYIPGTNLRMTEWQAAIGLAQLKRFPEQIEIRERNSNYLVELLKEVKGIEPIYRDPRVTRWCFYYWHFKFIPEKWNGISRDKFLQALSAEGIPCWTGHIEPLYKMPLFKEESFGRTGCPIKCPLYGKEIDYSNLYLPVVERVAREEACAFPHSLFLGPKSDMEKIVEAILKIRKNLDELKKI